LEYFENTSELQPFRDKTHHPNLNAMPWMGGGDYSAAQSAEQRRVRSSTSSKDLITKGKSWDLARTFDLEV
jgi:hypothetical protein